MLFQRKPVDVPPLLPHATLISIQESKEEDNDDDESEYEAPSTLPASRRRSSVLSDYRRSNATYF